jgi:hypothetical protein
VGESLEFVAECLWPDVRESDLRELDRRVCEETTRSIAAGGRVRYRGSLLMREDEVVLCLFDGQLEAIRDVARAAGIPFERILETARSPWKPEGANQT